MENNSSKNNKPKNDNKKNGVNENKTKQLNKKKLNSNDKAVIKNKKEDNKTKTTKSIKSQRNVDIEIINENINRKLEACNDEKINFKDKNASLTFSLFEVVLLIIITILSCILIGHVLIYPNLDKDNNKNNIVNEENIDNNVKLFLEQYNYILDNYYGNIDKQQLIKDAIEGMFSSLDDYSQMIDTESNSFTITLEGEYEGVGIVIYNDMIGNIIIDEVYENTPAYKAGLIAGDIIVKFNDISLNNVTTTELVEMIGKSTEMELTVLRNNEFVTVELKREKIVLDSVKSKIIKNNIGYIDINVFANNTAGQFETILNDLEKDSIKGLIIDLRDNTGGHLSAVEQMLYLFLDDNHIIYQMQDKNGVEKVYSKGKKDKNYEIVILQNNNSASASEIMAAALSEELDAYIIGNTSFGKGTVQTLRTVIDDVQYKFTTKRWLTPNGTWIEGVGISPNLNVDLPESYYLEPTEENDTQLKAAIDYLNN